jgi:hypothetical protein
VQASLVIYDGLRDEWDYMNGNYIGKSLLNLFQVFKLYDIPDNEYILVYKIIILIDSKRRTIIREKTKN